MPRDDLGVEVSVRQPASRVVSLVPSLTEAIASVAPETLIGVTDWCTCPAGLRAERIRGTKNPDVRRIVDLAPDLVIANQEENREIDVRRLRDAGVAVWVTRIETLDEAFSSIERLFDTGLNWPVPSWLAQARAAWATPPPTGGPRVIVPIWRDPWMVVGARTFTADLLRRAGAVVVPGDTQDRYPTCTLENLAALQADLVLLPDEPYVFTPDDGPESFSVATQLVSGRLLTWYGPSLAEARSYLQSVLFPK